MFTKLNLAVQELGGYITFKDKKNPKISKVDIGWQIDHSLKVIILVTESIISSEPAAYKWRFNLWRTILFTLGFIPRGKAKAPKMVRASKPITQDILNTQLRLAKHDIERLSQLEETANFKHFVFGQLNKKKTIKFLELHTEHHLKIIRDIISTSN